MNTTLKRIGATPGKLATIGLLCAVMALVWWQTIASVIGLDGGNGGAVQTVSYSSDRPTSNLPATNSRTRGPVGVQRSINQESLQPAVAVGDWPDMPIEVATRNDPFAKPQWAILRKEPQTVVASSTGAVNAGPATREELMEQGATMIVISGDRKVATIGGQEVTVGDFLGEYQVLDITKAGVILSESPKGG